MSNNSVNNEVKNNKKNKVVDAITRKVDMRAGIICMIFAFYMMFGFGTICVKGYEAYDLYKWYLLVIGAGVFIAAIGLCNLPKLDKGVKYKMSVMDYILCAMIVSWSIACISSVNRSSAILGDMHRKTGLFYVGFTVIAACLMARFMKHHFAVSIGFAVWTIITNILGIAQYYGKDLFNWQVYRQFTGLRSTFGNSNQYSAMCAIFLVVLIGIFIYEKNLPTLIITGVALIVDIIGGLAASSASFYFVAFGVLVAIGFAFRNVEHLKRLWIASVLIYAGLLIQRYFYNRTDDWQYFNEQITLWIFNSRKFVIALGVMIAVLGVIVFLGKPVIDKYGVIVSRVWFVLCGLILLTVIGLFIYVNKDSANIAEDAFLYKFVINDNFGSGRGKIWREVLSAYKEAGIKDKLFGVGFDNIPRFNFCAEDYNAIGETVSDAHNAYIDMLFNCGILGAGLYFALIITMIVKAVRGIKENPAAAVTVIAAATYLAVILVNFNMNIFFPTCFMVMGYGMSFAKERGGE